MIEQEINVFIERILDYFQAYDADSPPNVGTPYLINGIDDHVLEFTGVIGITGRNVGTVMFSAPPSMLVMLIARYGEVGRTTPEMMLDLVGEVANTIAGNAREVFGSKFELAPPIALRAPLRGMVLAKGLQSYCIPIEWRLRKAHLIVSLT
jgi:chemotaxis protein CheX